MSYFRTACLTALATVTLSASAIGVVAPAANANIDGDANNLYPFGSDLPHNSPLTRYQQVFAATDFSELGGAVLLTSLSFRPDVATSSTSYAFSGSLALSTTARSEGGLLSNLSSNVGVDARTVFSGATTLTTSQTVLGNGTYAFDVLFNFTTPFIYNPTKGNLLIDYIFASSTATSLVLDATQVTGDGTSRAYVDTGGTFVSDTVGLVARFEASPVPQPATSALLSVGVFVLTLLRGRQIRAFLKGVSTLC